MVLHIRVAFMLAWPPHACEKQNVTLTHSAQVTGGCITLFGIILGCITHTHICPVTPVILLTGIIHLTMWTQPSHRPFQKIYFEAKTSSNFPKSIVWICACYPQISKMSFEEFRPCQDLFLLSKKKKSILYLPKTYPLNRLGPVEGPGYPKCFTWHNADWPALPFQVFSQEICRNVIYCICESTDEHCTFIPWSFILTLYLFWMSVEIRWCEDVPLRY